MRSFSLDNFCSLLVRFVIFVRNSVFVYENVSFGLISVHNFTALLCVSCCQFLVHDDTICLTFLCHTCPSEYPQAEGCCRCVVVRV